MVRISPRDFDAVLRRVIEELPEPFAALLERVPVIVDPVPTRELAAALEDPGELLGLYLGPPMEEWERADAPPETAVILLFHRHLELACASREELEQQIRITLLHELGHAIGFGEDGLHDLGLG